MSSIAPRKAIPPAAIRQFILAGLLMLICLGLAIWLKPTRLWADKVGVPDLEVVVPKSFGNWVESPYGAKAIVNPQQEETLRNIYTSTLARTYVNTVNGRVIMLSIAYGKDQTRDTQLHSPEQCYGSQGFRVTSLVPADIKTGGLELPVMRMDTEMGVRHELVTYWIRVGDQLSRGSLQRNLVRMRFAAAGYIADGLLFRISEVTRADRKDSYGLQDEFMDGILQAMKPVGRDSLVGGKSL